MAKALETTLQILGIFSILTWIAPWVLPGIVLVLVVIYAITYCYRCGRA